MQQQEYKEIYRQTMEQARLAGEIQLWRASYEENQACARAIEKAISERYENNHLSADIAKRVIEEYGYDRVNWVLANTVREGKSDGRYSAENKKWSQRFQIPTESEHRNSYYAVSSHPCLVDGVTGIVFYKGDLDECRRWQQDEDGIIESSAREHNYVNGICSNCGEKDAMGVIYGYNAAKGVYYVAGYNGSDENVTVFSTWDDGKNGEKPVKYLAAAAFKDNTTIKKVILPASVDSLEGSVFWGCENLEYVSMTGITNLEYASPYGGDGRNNNFRNCFKLSVVITSNALSSNVGQFGCGATDTSNKKILDFYVYGESGAPSLDYETADANNLCSGNVYYYSETEKSGCWHYVNGVATLWN